MSSQSFSRVWPQRCTWNSVFALKCSRCGTSEARGFPPYVRAAPDAWGFAVAVARCVPSGRRSHCKSESSQCNGFSGKRSEKRTAHTADEHARQATLTLLLRSRGIRGRPMGQELCQREDLLRREQLLRVLQQDSPEVLLGFILGQFVARGAYCHGCPDASFSVSL